MDPSDDSLRKYVFKFFVAVALSLLLGLNLYSNFVEQARNEPYEEGDLSSVKYVVSQLAEGISELTAKHARLQNDMERLTEQLPVLWNSAGKAKAEIGTTYNRVNRHGIDVKNYDLQIHDFALESAGGRILDTGNTINHVVYDSTISWLLFQLTSILCKGCDGARAMLQPSSLPGECWAFKGSHGEAVVQLLGSVDITGVTLEHIPPNIAPTREISSAPRRFQLEGLESRSSLKGHDFGKFEYNKEGKPIQYFEVVRPSSHYYNLVRLRILTNWGHPIYTCIYRVRIHGQLAPGQGYIAEEKQNNVG